MAGIVLAVGIGLVSPVRAADAPSEFERWEKSIADFEARDAKSPPPKGAVLFVGSSSIKLWKLEDSFPGGKVINRGFGGSKIADSTHFADRIIIPHEPRAVVLYAGDNDLARGKTPEQVADDFRAFVEKVRSGLPETEIYFISIKPSIRRWSMLDKVRVANSLIQSQCEKEERLHYIDIAPEMLDVDGLPKSRLFAPDGLHLSPEGYAVWARCVLDHVKIDGISTPEGK